MKYKQAMEDARDQIRETLEAYKGENAEKRPGFKYGLRYALSVINDSLEEAEHGQEHGES